MTNHDYLSDKTRSFRKGVLTFSAFLVLAISYDLKVTEIPSLGIEKIDPNIVFTGNLIALIYLFVSYMFYYLQDRVHHNRSDLVSALKEREVKRTKKYLKFITHYIEKQFQPSNGNSHLDSHALATRSHILRIMMKERTASEMIRKSIEAIVDNVNEQTGLNLPAARISSNLLDERSNYLSAKERSWKLEANQVTVNSVVGVWDFWVPITSAVLAFVIFMLKVY